MNFTTNIPELTRSASYLDVLLKVDVEGKLTSQTFSVANGMITISPLSTSLIYVDPSKNRSPHLLVCRKR
jgi:hypothetical protein